jgi:hypothetical protein
LIIIFLVQFVGKKGGLMKYITQKGDICRWSYLGANYAQEYDGERWSDPIALKDLAIIDAAKYVRVIGLEQMEVVHSIKRRRTKYYRRKA